MQIHWKITDSFNLESSLLINQVLTQYADNPKDSNLVLDLMFLQVDMEEFNNHQILSDLQSSSDHASLSVLWQPLITRTNDHTNGKYLRMDIKWKFHKRT